MKAVPEAFETSISVPFTEEWYSDPKDFRSPHDAWLEGIEVSRPQSTPLRSRSIVIKISLLAAYHNGLIEFHYSEVGSFSISEEVAYSLPTKIVRRPDYLEDAFREKNDHIEHTIQWEVGVWRISAKKIIYRWIPGTGTDSVIGNR